MDGFVPFLAAQDRTTEIAHSARADSPVRPEPPRRDLRLRISTAIHRLADRVDPRTDLSPRAPVTPGAKA